MAGIGSLGRAQRFGVVVGGRQDGSGGDGNGGDHGGGPGAPGARPPLQIDVETPAQKDELVLIQREAGRRHMMFQYAGLATVIERTRAPKLFVDAEKTEPLTTARPTIMGGTQAMCVAGDVAHFVRHTANGPVRKPVPDWVRMFLPTMSVEPLPPLAGVIRHPVINQDGSLMSGRIGYDPDSCYYIDAPMPAGPPLEDLDDPATAYAFLTEIWLTEFSFATEDDKARAIMFALTLMTSRTVLGDHGKFPAFLATSAVASSGKTELIEVITRAVTGMAVPFAVFPRDNEEEMGKLMLAITQTDPTVFCFDNIPNGAIVRSAVLDSYITSNTFQGRILGQTRMADFPALAVVAATGNNIEPDGDSLTRFLEIRLEPDTDAPQNIVYDRDLRRWTQEHRHHILRALRAIFLTSHDQPRTGRFPTWFDRVAGPIMQVSGRTGALEAWRRNAVTVERAEPFGSLLQAMHAFQEHHHVKGMSAAELVDFCLLELDDLLDLPVGAMRELRQRIDDDTPHDARMSYELTRRKMIKGVMRRLNPWRRQVSGGFRLTFVEWRNSIGKTSKLASAERVQGGFSSQPDDAE